MDRPLMKVERSFDIARANEIANDPSVYRWVHGATAGPMDTTWAISNPNNVLIIGEHGAEFFILHQDGIYEAHTMVLPTGRGKWAVEFVEAALHYLFTHTPAVEVWTRIPQGNRKALALVKAIGGIFDCHVENGWVMDHKMVSADIYSMRIQDWMRNAKDVGERGRWFHDTLEREFERLGAADEAHDDEEVHDRYVGLAVDMIRGGQLAKASIFYNRFAIMGGYQPMAILTLNPTTIDIGNAVLVVRDDDSFWVMSVTPKQPSQERATT